MISFTLRFEKFLLLAGLITRAVSHFPMETTSSCGDMKSSSVAMMAISTATFTPSQNLLYAETTRLG